MDKLTKIRSQRSALAEKADALMVRVKADERAMTDEERTSVDGWLDEIEGFDSEETVLLADQKRSAKVSGISKRLDQPVEPSRPLTNPGDVPRQSEEIRITSPTRQLRSFVGPDGITRPEDESRAYTSGRWLQAVYGMEDARSWCRDNGIEYRIMTEGLNTGGGYLVPSPLASTIINLQNEWGVARQVCQMWPMTSDTVQLPKQATNSGLTASWTGEASTITASDLGVRVVQLTAKKLATLTRISTELLEDSVIDVADLVAEDAARRFVESEDDAWINGDGTSTYGGIYGIAAQFNANETWLSVATAAAGHDTAAEYDVSDLSGVIGAVAPYAYQSGGPSWFCSQAMKSLILERLGQAGGGTNVVTIGGGLQALYSGYPIVVSNKLPTDGSADQSQTTVLLFGNMRQAVVFGDRRTLTIKTLNELYAASDEVGIQATERIDIVFHDTGSTTTVHAVAGLMGD